MSTPTPETDALVDYLKAQFPATDGHLLLREKIGKLERERDEARFSAAHRKHLLEGCQFHREKAESERDQLRKVCDELAAELNHYVLSDPHPVPSSSEALKIYNSLPHVAEKKICSQTSK